MKKVIRSPLCIMLLLNITTVLPIKASVFDNILWQYERSRKNITLYLQKEKGKKINFYKAETIIDNINFNTVVQSVLSFSEYNKIFANTKFFNKVHDINKNEYILNAELNFFPYRNRTYFINCKYKKEIIENQVCHIIEWHPLEKQYYNYFNNIHSKAKLIKYVHGKWVIKDLGNNGVYIGLFYHNDWETNLPISLVHAIEKFVTIKNLKHMVAYCKEKAFAML